MGLSPGVRMAIGIAGVFLVACCIVGIYFATKKDDSPSPAPAASTGGTTGGTTQQCQVGNWSAWSSCNASCGDGVQTRTRTVTSQGNNCPPLTETQPCASYSGCSACTYGAWSEWTPCNSTCGNGQQYRTASLLPGNNNPTCMANNQDSRDCSDYSRCSSNSTAERYAAGSRLEGQTCNSKFDCDNPDYHRCNNGVCEFYND